MSPLREPGVSRPDWAPPQSSGWFDDQIIRAANWLRTRSNNRKENRMAKQDRIRTTEDDLTQQQRDERDRQLAQARTMTDTELAAFTAGVAAWDARQGSR